MEPWSSNLNLHDDIDQTAISLFHLNMAYWQFTVTLVQHNINMHDWTNITMQQSICILELNANTLSGRTIDAGVPFGWNVVSVMAPTPSLMSLEIKAICSKQVLQKKRVFIAVPITSLVKRLQKNLLLAVAVRLSSRCSWWYFQYDLQIWKS